MTHWVTPVFVLCSDVHRVHTHREVKLLLITKVYGDDLIPTSAEADEWEWISSAIIQDYRVSILWSENK